MPPLQELTRLEVASVGPSCRRGERAWGGRQALTLLGVALLLAAVVGALALPANPGRLPDPAFIQEASQDLAPIQAWRQWRLLRATGPAGDPETEDEREARRTAQRTAEYRWWARVGAVLVVGGAGLGLAVGPLVTRRRA